MNKKIIFISVIFILFIGALFLFFKDKSSKVNVLFYNTSKIQENEVLSIISSKMNNVNITFDSYQSETLTLFELLSVNKYDLVFTNETRDLIAASSLFNSNNINTGAFSSTLKKFSSLENGSNIYPIEIDHVELAISNKTYNKLYKSENTILNLNELEEVLLDNKKDYKYPLMIAGKNNLPLFDAISLITISLCGKNGLDKLLTSYGNSDFSKLLNINLGNSKTLKDVLEKFIRWKKEGLLHPEWLRFTRDDVKSFIEDDLSSAFILRLSEHRKYEIKIMNKFKAIKFPSTYDKKYATDILSIPFVCAIPQSSKSSLGKNIIELLLNETSQEKLTYATGLAPVHSNVTAMDVQASNLRYWVAASSSISTAYYLFPQNDTLIESFLDNVRVYLK